MRVPAKLGFAAIALAAIVFTGCAKPVQFVPMPKAPNAEMARVYVVRPSNFGGAIPMQVHDGEKLIGETGPSCYLMWDRKPGPCTITSKAENTSQVGPFETLAGMAYYIFQHMEMGFVSARNSLEIITEAKGKELVGTCTPASAPN